MPRYPLILLCLLAILGLSSLAVQGAGQSILVNTIYDDDIEDSSCSLREAIISANNDFDYGGCINDGDYGGTEQIEFDSAVFSSPQTITLTADLPEITGRTWIKASTANIVSIDGQGLYRPFHVNTNQSSVPGTFAVQLARITVSHGKDASGGGLFVEAGAVRIDSMTFNNNVATTEDGGAIRNNTTLSIYTSSFNNNSAVNGGAIYSWGDIYVISSVFNGNTATNMGGAIYNPLNTSAANSPVIVGSLFLGNSAVSGGAVGGHGKIVNSTLTGNSATTNGGAVYNNITNTSVRLYHNTISGNTASNTGGVYVATGSGNFGMVNTILANNTGGDCYRGGAVTGSPSHNIIQDGTCNPSDGTALDPLLDPLGLQNNGGLMQTIAISPASPAVNMGNDSYKAETFIGDINGDGDTLDALTTDQRGTGFPRENQNTVDIGAFETNFAGLTVDINSDTNRFACTIAANDCSLRGAINIANNLLGTDTISFDATVFGTAKTISLSADLPSITQSLIITGSGSNLLTINGNNAYRLFYIDNSASLSISAIYLRNGTGVSGNGGAFNVNSGSLSMNNMLVSANYVGGAGGAIYSNTGTSVTVNNSVISSNSAVTNGGAIYNNGSLRINNSSLNDNIASLNGGAVFANSSTIINASSFNNNNAFNNGGAIVVAGQTSIFNSTFYSNYATGGTIYNSDSLQLINVTIAGNDTGGILTTTATVSIMNSISAENAGAACSSSAGNPTINHSLFDTSDCGISDGVNGNRVTSSLLDTAGLQNNGGLVQTIALPPVSPAKDAGNNSYLSEATVNVDFNGDTDTSDSLDTDQRGLGFNRIDNAIVDMGAFETSGTFTGLMVDTASDSSLIYCTSAANDCSLRGAISLANGLLGADTISFDATVFATAQTISLESDFNAISDDLTINGAGSNLLSIDAEDGQPFTINNAAVVSISGLKLMNADNNSLGGTILVNDGLVTVNNSSFENNQGISGGAIYAGYGTSLNVNNSHFSGNSSTNDGGAINGATASTVNISNSSFSGNSAGTHGGAVFSDSAVFIAGSSFAGNSANNGGAIYANMNSTIKVGNSSLYANTASTNGGAIHVDGNLFLLHVTVSANTALSGGGLFVTSGTTTLSNSIIGNSTGGDCNSVGGSLNFNYSLVEDAGCGIPNGVNGNLIGDPYIAPFVNYGGTMSMLGLLPFSPAINTGNNSYLNETTVNFDFNFDGDTLDTLDTDQRGIGFNRIINTTVDMGAFEANPSSSTLNVAPIRNYFMTDTPTLTWGHISWAIQYELQISSATSFSALLCNGTYHIDAPLLSQTTCQLSQGTYYWRVRAISGTGAGPWSTVDVFVIGGP